MGFLLTACLRDPWSHSTSLFSQRHTTTTTTTTTAVPGCACMCLTVAACNIYCSFAEHRHTHRTHISEQPDTVFLRRRATRMQDVSADAHERTHTLEGRDTVSLRQPQRDTSAGWNTRLTARHNPHGAAENTRVRRPGQTDESLSPCSLTKMIVGRRTSRSLGNGFLAARSRPSRHAKILRARLQPLTLLGEFCG